MSVTKFPLTPKYQDDSLTSQDNFSATCVEFPSQLPDEKYIHHYSHQEPCVLTDLQTG